MGLQSPSRPTASSNLKASSTCLDLAHRSFPKTCRRPLLQLWRSAGRRPEPAGRGHRNVARIVGIFRLQKPAIIAFICGIIGEVFALHSTCTGYRQMHGSAKKTRSVLAYIFSPTRAGARPNPALRQSMPPTTCKRAESDGGPLVIEPGSAAFQGLNNRGQKP